MRNMYECCEGEAIIGRIIYGKKFPFGVVSEETYTADMAALNGAVLSVTSSVDTLSGRVNEVSENVTGISQSVTVINAALRISDLILLTTHPVYLQYWLQ